MKKITGTFPGTSGLCRVRFYIYTPEKPRAVVMLSHGMCEYIERYHEFAQFLCDNDIALCGNDHIGHGNSITDMDMLGYFGHSEGYLSMVRDLNRMRVICTKMFPNIPCFLMGHSMGSFLARIYLAKYTHRWDGAVIMGTAGGAVGAAPLSRALEPLIGEHGETYRHDFGTRLAYGLFNLRTENRRTPYDWLSRDDAEVDKFCADPKCAFTFTLAGYRDLLDALHFCNSREIITRTPKDLPMLFLSGGMDPVGEYGMGVRAAYRRYVKCGCNAGIRIYREARHELLHELNRKEVMEDILVFLNKYI